MLHAWEDETCVENFKLDGNVEIDLEEREHVLDSCSLGQSLVAGFCGHGSGHSDFLNVGKFH